MDKKVRVRIAPSPTGNLHVGTARAALFNELFARKHKGDFILRIEDTDSERSKEEFVENIVEGLSWLGLSWDEDPVFQSKRTELYTAALQKLLDEDKAYMEDNAVRLRVKAEEVSFNDAIRGNVTVHTDSFEGDFVIARSLDSPLYHVAVVVDDADMNISHVIRGEDHIHNTIKHILIQRALGYEQPEYAHLPLLLDVNRKKLSKRSGETSLLVYRDKGYLPEAMLNYLALLGWGAKDDREFYTHEELIEEFSLDGIQKSGAIFSVEKLDSINRHYLSELSENALYEWGKKYFDDRKIEVEDKERFVDALKTEQERVASYDGLENLIEWYRSDFVPEDAKSQVEALRRKKGDDFMYGHADVVDNLEKALAEWSSYDNNDFTEDSLQTKTLAWIDDAGLDRGAVLWPLRVALTGHEHSPGPFEVGATLKKEITLHHIQTSLEILNTK